MGELETLSLIAAKFPRPLEGFRDFQRTANNTSFGRVAMATLAGGVGVGAHSKSQVRQSSREFAALPFVSLVEL